MKRRRGAGAASIVPGGLDRSLRRLWPARGLESWEQSGRDAQTKRAHPGEKGAEGGGAVLSRAGRGGRQNRGER